MTHSVLQGPLLKVDWGKQHIRNLETLAKRFLDGRPYAARREEQRDAGRVVWIGSAQEDPPTEIALTAGDAIHNLRSALDHLVIGLIKHNGNEPTNLSGFPIFKTAGDFDGQLMSKVRGVSNDAMNLLKQARPDPTRPSILWELGKLDNIDKHRVLFTVGCASAIPQLNIGPEGADTPDIISTFFHFIHPFKDGAEVFAVPYTPGVNVDPVFKFAIALNEIGVAEGWPVVEALDEMAHLADGIIRRFEAIL